jgi:hypothetical protein
MNFTLCRCLGLFLVVTAATAAERVATFSAMPADDQMVINFSSVGCYHELSLTLTYLPIGDGAFQVEALGRGQSKDLGRASLKPGDMRKLDALLEFYRSAPRGKCTTVDAAHFRQIRGGVVVAEESFVDLSCATSRKAELLTFLSIAQPLFKEDAYGEKSESAICVKIWGEVVPKRGVHYVKNGASLLELVSQAAIPSQASHRLTVSRQIIPQVYQYFEFGIDAADAKDLAAFRLASGDEVDVRPSQK